MVLRWDLVLQKKNILDVGRGVKYSDQFFFLFFFFLGEFHALDDKRGDDEEFFFFFLSFWTLRLRD